MADLQNPNVFIQVRIQEETEHGQFNDSLYFTVEEFEALTDKELAAQMSERVSKWVQFINDQKNAVPAPDTVEDLTQQKLEHETVLAEVNEKLAEVKLKESLWNAFEEIK